MPNTTKASMVPGAAQVISGKDGDWISKSFLIPESINYDKSDFKGLVWSSAELKYTDTTPGGNTYINTPPQFTKYADPPAKSNVFGSDTKGLSGINGSLMGRYYSEVIDDYSQVVHFRMGKPRFNTLSNFYLNSYRTELGSMVNKNRISSFAFHFGKSLGFIVSVFSFQIFVLRLLAESAHFLSRMPDSKYYYHSPAMNLYWRAVTTLVNQFAVNKGIIARVGEGNSPTASMTQEEARAYAEELHSFDSDIFTKTGGIDVYKLSTKGARKYYRHLRRLEKTFGAPDDYTIENFSGKLYDEYIRAARSVGSNPRSRSLDEYIEDWYGTTLADMPGENAPIAFSPDGEEEQIQDSDTGVPTTEEWLDAVNADSQTKLSEFFRAELDDGAAFASFRVDSTGSVSESFSNTAGEPEIKQKLDSMVSTSRSFDFSTASGNISEMMGKVVDMGKQLVSGVLSSFRLGGLTGLAGAGFFDIPLVWENSSASLPRANYNIRLSSPYGNPISQLLNIYLPLCMILAMGLPQATGRQSYSSPFLIEFYDKGRQQSRLGLVESITVTRGTSNLPFNSEGSALAIDVSLSIMDLSTVLYMPINMGLNPISDILSAAKGFYDDGITGAGQSFLGDAATDLFSDGSAFTDYMAVLASMGVADQIYDFRAIKLALSKKLANWRSWSSVGNFAGVIGESFPGRLASSLFPGVQF